MLWTRTLSIDWSFVVFNGYVLTQVGDQLKRLGINDVFLVCFGFPRFSSFGECLRVINVEAHAAHGRMANAIIKITMIIVTRPRQGRLTPRPPPTVKNGWQRKRREQHAKRCQVCVRYKFLQKLKASAADIRKVCVCPPALRMLRTYDFSPPNDT